MTQVSPMHVLLMDDHALVRQGIKQLIAQEFPEAVFGEARNLAEAKQHLRSQDWTVMILDISVPDGNGLDLLQEVHLSHPTARVLLLSMYPERQYAVRALRAGAAGYITKDSALDELIRAIKKILSGGRYVSSALAEHLASEIHDRTGRFPHERLSTREFAVVCGVAAGKKAADLAVEMGLNAKTISTYRRRAMAKMHLLTNADLIRYAIEHRLI